MIFNKKKKLEAIRSRWGKPIERFRNLDLISVYHDIISKYDDGNYVDKKTWSDLNFDSIFSLMDRNTSAIGQQYLYHLMHKYERDENILRQRFELIKLLQNNNELREEIQLPLARLNETNAYFVPNVILNGSLPYSKYYRWFYLFGYLPVVLFMLIFYNGIFLFAALGSLAVNIVLNQIFSRRIYEYFSGFAGINTLIIAAKCLAAIKSDLPIEDLKVLCSKKNLLSKLGKKFSYLVMDKETMNELIASAVEYANMIFLYDIIAYYRSVNLLLKSQASIHEVYKAVANLDLCISLASYLEETQYYSNPIFIDQRKIEFEEMYHPLIENAVSNSLDDISKSILVTGSNMSGKTTFIKTAGINIVLSQTLYFCLAKKLVCPKYCVKAAIKREEDLEEGKSYFFVEVEELQHFLELSEKGGRYVFFIDEIFRGTNTIERLAASTAVLKELNKQSIAFVTTHDIELQELLCGSYEMIHFSEQVEGSNYYFDYKIRKGPCSSGNAIKLLEIKNYPKNIIDEATDIVRNLLTNGAIITNKD